ncbi:MAG: dipeptide/oligopeptide/nickel ABC transporter ATP-binding protein [Candidatus Omnitrophota bacterium]|nr:dipeptide/oligopeptide/nickel ABC transporter ATP-binding protein [Candidatus Omnitrophota bacterium]
MMIRCEDVKKYFKGRAGVIKAVDGVSLEIEKGDTFGIVGESGCGKTTLGKMMLGILSPDSGNIVLGTDNVQVIFQDPYHSLDPKMKIFDILAEGLIVGRSDNIKQRVERILDLIKLPENALKKYPHQFSGGERQRIAIGRAVLTNPEFIVCDEPVSSLDVTIQFQILTLLKDVQKKFNITYLFISHDLRVVKFMCNKLAVMYAGKIIESGNVKDVYADPSQGYTKTLLSSAFYDTIKK